MIAKSQQNRIELLTRPGIFLQDGGCTCPGDVAKAIGAGADFVMLGGMLAGHDQSGGEVITGEDGKKRKLFYGMSSATAMKKHKGGVAEYRASEGKTVEVSSLTNTTIAFRFSLS